MTGLFLVRSPPRDIVRQVTSRRKAGRAGGHEPTCPSLPTSITGCRKTVITSRFAVETGSACHHAIPRTPEAIWKVRKRSVGAACEHRSKRRDTAATPLLADLLHLVADGIVGSMQLSRKQQQTADLFQVQGVHSSFR